MEIEIMINKRFFLNLEAPLLAALVPPMLLLNRNDWSRASPVARRLSWSVSIEGVNNWGLCGDLNGHPGELSKIGSASRYCWNGFPSRQCNAKVL